MAIQALTRFWERPSRICFRKASVLQVNYINAHATSTLVGDVAELNAVKKVFANLDGIKMNGTKSMTGHSLGAAGGLEGIATIKAIQTGWVHPTINQVPVAGLKGCEETLRP